VIGVVRPKMCRRVSCNPDFTYFKPQGVRIKDIDDLILTIDEFEAVRLKDFEGMGQDAAAKKMNISQPTFHRLVLTARKKIADAIVNGKAIKIEGGNVKMMQKAMCGHSHHICICHNCGFKIKKESGVRCNQIKCPECDSILKRS
jgi:predicted DNA-binding protein (UPF0251 family)